MATVTGGYSPGEEEGVFSRRGPGAGKFRPPGAAPTPEGFAGNYLAGIQGLLSGLPGLGGMFGQRGPGITGNYDPELAQAVATGQGPTSRVTGDVQAQAANVTAGGGGRGTGTGRVTSGRGGAAPTPASVAGLNLRGLQNFPLGRTAFLGGLIPGVMEAGSELQAGRPTGALAALGAGAVTSAAGAALLKAPNLLAKVAGGALLLGGSMIPAAGAQIAESTRQSLTGKPTKGKEEEFSTQMAMRGQILNQNLDGLNRSTAIQLQATKDLTTFYNQAQVQQFKAMAPELEKAKMNDFARYQTAMALQGQIQGQLGTLATAGALAQGSQQGNYVLAQTALTNNPYTQAIMPAPQIRFG